MLHAPAPMPRTTIVAPTRAGRAHSVCTLSAMAIALHGLRPTPEQEPEQQGQDRREDGLDHSITF